MGISAYIDQLLAKFNCELARRTAIRELSTLDDRQLDNIGLYRGAVVAEVDAWLNGCSGRGDLSELHTTQAPRLE